MTNFFRRVPADASLRRPTVAVVGVGAIGTVVADALTGRADVLLARRGTSEAMSIDLDGTPRRVDAAVAGSPAGLGPVDWVVVAVKAHDTPAIEPWLDALVGPQTTVVVLQNGIGHAERVSEWVPAERVVPGIVYIAAEKTGRDLVVGRDLGALALAAGANADRAGANADRAGENADRAGGKAAEFAALVDDRLAIRLVDDFLTESWSKLVMNSALNTVTAITNRSMEVTGDAAVRPLLRSLLVEGSLVAEAAGARLPADAADLFLARMDGLPRNSATSMLLDHRAGRPLEHEFLTGAVLAAADRHAVQVPMIRMVHGLVDALAPRGVRPGVRPGVRSGPAGAHAATAELAPAELAAADLADGAASVPAADLASEPADDLAADLATALAFKGSAGRAA